MYTITVEKRDINIKAKKIRRNGMVPCSIENGKTNETILIQLSDSEARKLIRSKAKGAKVLLSCNAESYPVIIKNIVIMQLNNQIESIDFQLLHEDELVHSFANVILYNRDKVQRMIYQPVKEIPYKAYPQDLVEEVKIDVAEIKPGSGLMLKDLSIWQNQNIKCLINEDRSIVSVV